MIKKWQIPFIVIAIIWQGFQRKYRKLRKHIYLWYILKKYTFDVVNAQKCTVINLKSTDVRLGTALKKAFNTHIGFSEMRATFGRVTLDYVNNLTVITLPVCMLYEDVHHIMVRVIKDYRISK